MQKIRQLPASPVRHPVWDACEDCGEILFHAFRTAKGADERCGEIPSGVPCIEGQADQTTGASRIPVDKEGASAIGKRAARGDGRIQETRQWLVPLVGAQEQGGLTGVLKKTVRGKQGLLKGVVAAAGGDVGACGAQQDGDLAGRTVVD